MASILLAPYTLTINNRSASDYTQLSDSYDASSNSFNFTEFLKNFFDELKGRYSKNEESKQVLSLIDYEMQADEYENVKYFKFYGTIKTGAYGEETELVDVETQESRTKKESEAELRPYYFQIYYRDKSNKALLVLERIGNSGIRTIFSQTLSEFLATDFLGEFSLGINQLFHQEIFNSYLSEARVQKLRFIRHSLPPDVADQLDLIDAGVTHEDFEIEFVVSAKRNKSIPIRKKIWEKIAGEESIDDGALLELKEINKSFGTNTTKIEINNNGKTKVISIENYQNTRTYLDITKLVTFVSGFPEFNSIHKEASEYVNDLSLKFGWVK